MRFLPTGLNKPIAGFAIACVLVVFSTFSPANAKHEKEESVPEAADQDVTAPRLVVPEYRSPLSNFQSFEDAEPQDWKEANDRVGEIGGWRVYSREPFEPDAAEDADDADMDEKDMHEKDMDDKDMHEKDMNAKDMDSK